jgi:hypothetical protein
MNQVAQLLHDPLSLAGLLLGLLGITVFILWQWRKSKRVPKEGKFVEQPVADSKIQELAHRLEGSGPLTETERAKIRQTILEEAAKGKKLAIPGKFPALVFTEGGITFEKIPERIGNVIQLEPSMPERGPHYMVTKTEDGDYVAYDPRLAPLISEETPQSAFEAVNWYPEVNAVYANKYGLWDKINSLLVGLAIVGFVLVAIVAIDKLGK